MKAKMQIQNLDEAFRAFLSTTYPFQVYYPNVSPGTENFYAC